MTTGVTTPSGIGSGSEVLISARMRNLTRGAFRQIRKDMRSTSSASRNLVSGGLNFVNSALGTLRTLAFAGAAGLGALAAAFGTAQIRAASHAKQIQNIADTYGVTTVEVQALTNIVRRAGIEGANVRDLFEGVTDALIKVRAGGENIEKALALTGITRGQFLNADFVQRLELIANGLESIEDPGLRAAVAADLAEDSFQRYNSVLSRIARGSLPTVIRQEVELTGEVLPSQNRRLTENQVAWRLLADRFLTFRQNVATQFAPAANLILRHLREWVAQIEGPVSMAVAGLNTDVTNFLATSEISDHLAFELGIDPNEPSPAESFLDEIKEQVNEIIKNIDKVVQPLITYLDNYFLGVDPSSAQSQYLLSIGADVAIPERSLRTQLTNIVVGVFNLFAALFGDDTPEKRRAQMAIIGAIQAVFEAVLVAIALRLVSISFWQDVADAVWDGIQEAITGQNQIQGRSNSFANEFLAGLELLFSLVAGILIGRRFGFGTIGKLILSGIIAAIITSFGEDSEGQQSIADKIAGWLTAAIILLSFGGIAKTLVQRMISSWVVALTLQQAFGSSRLSGRLKKIWTAAMLFLFPEGALISGVINMVKRMFRAIVSAIAASKGAALIAGALRQIFILVFGQMFVESLAGLGIKEMVKRMFTHIVTAIRTGGFAAVLVGALRAVFYIAFGLVFLTGVIPVAIVLMVAQLFAHIVKAIYGTTAVQAIATALCTVFGWAFTQMLRLGKFLLGLVTFVGEFYFILAAHLGLPVGVKAIATALLGAFKAAFAAIVVGAVGALLIVAVFLFVVWLIFEIAKALGLADTNPVEQAIAFFFNNILTNPGKIGAAIISGWIYIGKLIAFGIGKAFEATINYIIGRVNKFIRLVNKIISGLNKVPGVNIGRVSEIDRVDFNLSAPARPRRPQISSGTEGGQLYTFENPPPGYRRPNPQDQVNPSIQMFTPGTIIIDGTSVKAVFTDWAYNEGLGGP